MLKFPPRDMMGTTSLITLKTPLMHGYENNVILSCSSSFQLPPLPPYLDIQQRTHTSIKAAKEKLHNVVGDSLQSIRSSTVNYLWDILYIIYTKKVANTNVRVRRKRFGENICQPVIYGKVLDRYEFVRDTLSGKRCTQRAMIRER